MNFSSLQSRVTAAAYIPPHKTQLHPRMHSFNAPFPSSLPKPANSPLLSRDKYWILAATLLILPFVFYLFAIARGVHLSSKFSEPKPKGYGVIIHAGSTGSTVRVFEFFSERGIPFVGYDGSSGTVTMNSPRALMDFVDNPENAGNSIKGLMEFAKMKVPKRDRKDTKVRLMATGELGRVGPTARDGILESCRQVLRSSGFLFMDDWVSVLTGQEEGVYAWVAANYALGTLGGDPHDTIGIIELDGASAKVTLVPTEPPPMEFYRSVKLAGISYNLYSQSILNFGQDAVWESLHKKHDARLLTSSTTSIQDIRTNPCIPKGYNQVSDQTISLNASEGKHQEFYVGGNFSACRAEALVSLQERGGSCLDPPCGTAMLMTHLGGGTPSAANFFYTTELFGLVPRASLLDIEAAGQYYCESGWVKLRNEHRGIGERNLLRYCFSSAYIVALLHDILGLPMNAKRIGFANHTVGPPLDWTIGAFILQTVVEPETESDTLAHIVGDDSVTHLSLFAIFFLAIVAAFYISKWRKPQLKTVYDLEKGHYIVTRVPRGSHMK
ncbi:probable apyrase 6 isoform X2 [Aristolochia californica]|uniref:probable apyrase 6 isoform X2 n=2 Tax=Aristolochia californica TaxID=171875 RepID=UPI0035DC86F9